MKRPHCLSAIACLLIAGASIAAPPVITPNPVSELPSESESTRAWGMQIAPIPNILRMHCPVLKGNVGLLVADVAPDSPADRAGLREGDVVLQVQGSHVHDIDDLPEPSPRSRMLVLRHGRVQMPNQGAWSSGAASLNRGGDNIPRMMQQMLNHAAVPVPPAWARPGAMPGVQSGAFASSSSNGNESMSVSRAGNRVSIEMSSSAGGAPIRLQGTMEEIEQQIRSQELSPVIEHKIRQALGQ